MSKVLRLITETVSVSSVVTVVSLALAFSNWIRTALAVAWTFLYTGVEERLGLRTKKARYSSSAFKNKQHERLRQLETRDQQRRLTEINSRRMTSPRRQQQMNKRSTWDVRNLKPKPGFFRWKRGNANANHDAV
jgi:hypothetical protein